MSVTAAERAGAPQESVTEDLLDGHICRCTGYQGIRAAVARRWRELEEAR
jgi:aerobic-type carbon monoxide dehydrogenase small subunit (CoxS/CutS family)